MSVQDEIRNSAAEVLSLCRTLGIRDVFAYVQEPDETNLLFVADFDSSRLQGYADRFFQFQFLLQRIFGSSVVVLEKDIFMAEGTGIPLLPVSLEPTHAAA